MIWATFFLLFPECSVEIRENGRTGRKITVFAEDILS